MNPDLTRLRQQLRQLQALHDDGTLSAEAWAQARAPLEARLADLETGGDAAGADAAPTAEQMDRLVEQLAERMKEKPEDPVGWAMLGRAYSAMGRPADAVPAFKQALERGGESAGLLADYADALATISDGKLDGEPTRLVQRALALDPNHLKALALAGSIAFDTRDFRTAVNHWERVAQALPADSPFLGQVRASIAQARELGGPARVPPARRRPSPGASRWHPPSRPASSPPTPSSSSPAPPRARACRWPCCAARPATCPSTTASTTAWR
ncbi:tetratricopeptide repeat protein [Piscinibacter sakaiensis]|uniref:tetratricopeptide repeat protein n=1 Tax=Piscinibacter sakaiensis TaxID=1547922 RepID=UPI00372ADCC1